MMQRRIFFRFSPVAAAIGLAFVAGQAYAATLTSANVPVNGTVVVGGATGSVTGTTGDFGTTPAAGTLTVTVSSTLAVITWGAASSATTGMINSSATYSGFNINSGSTVAVAGTGATLLNVDVSGQASTLNGVMQSPTANVYLANANGIIVGSTANFTGVAGELGLFAANVPDATSLSATGSAIGLDFSTGGSLSVADGALLGRTTILAGAGTVNVTDTANVNGAAGVNLTIVGGTAGTIDAATGVYTATTAASLTLATTNGTTAATVALANVATNVNLDLGAATIAATTVAATVAAVPYSGALDVNANGNVSISSTSVINDASTFAWTGTLTNNGALTDNGGTVGNATAGALTNYGTLTAVRVQVGGALTNSGTINAGTVSAGSIVASNIANTGTIAYAPGTGALMATSTTGSVVNSGSITGDGELHLTTGGDFTNSGTVAFGSTGAVAQALVASIGGTFSNTGTISLSNSGATSSLTISAANFSNTGTLTLADGTSATSAVSIVASSSATLGGTLSAVTLQNFTFSAGAAPGDTAAVNTAVTATGAVSLSGFNVGVNAAVSGNTVTATVGTTTANASVGTFTVASGASLTATSTTAAPALAINSATSSGGAYLNPSNVMIAGTVSAPSVMFNGLNNVQDSGNIVTNSVTFDLYGNLNQVNGGGTAKNNYLDNAAVVTALNTTSPVAVTLDAVGTHYQLWNLKVVGDAQVASDTPNFTSGGINNGLRPLLGDMPLKQLSVSSSFALPAANALSQLRLQVTGNMYVVPSSGYNSYGISGYNTFTWPGLTVLIAGGNLISSTAIDNAIAASVPGGNGVFLQGATLQLNAPVYTSGNAWINFDQTNYATNPSSIISPLGMTSYYVTNAPANTATGVNSYVPVAAPSDQLKLGRQFVVNYVPQ